MDVTKCVDYHEGLNIICKSFTTDPIEIGQLVLKIQAVEGLQKWYKRKKICFGFVWLYLIISICEF